MTLARWAVHLLALCAACQTTATSPAEVGRVREKSLNEASGIVMSRHHPGVYWTHNDGDDGVLYAIRRDGTVVGRSKVDAKFRDWEDIAIDSEGRLYLADVGNNARDRRHVSVYRVDEPDPGSSRKTDVTRAWRLGFPDEPFNCESLFIHDANGYVISKVGAPERAVLYRFPLAASGKQVVLERVCDLPITEPVTAADISADGRWLAVLSQRTLSIFQIDGDVKKAADATPRKFPIPPIQAEGCCFNADGVLIIAESGEILQTKFDATPATTRPAN
jgi:sugar lactone lactonase YvrE